MEAQNLPPCFSNQINMMLKFQLPRPKHSGVRTFRSFRRTCYCLYTLSVLDVKLEGGGSATDGDTPSGLLTHIDNLLTTYS